MVTGSIAILAILVVGILALADTERESAEAFAEGVEVRNLAEVPVNLAIGQHSDTNFDRILSSWICLYRRC